MCIPEAFLYEEVCPVVDGNWMKGEVAGGRHEKSHVTKSRLEDISRVSPQKSGISSLPEPVEGARQALGSPTRTNVGGNCPQGTNPAMPV
jgi:hypothetical protein